MKNSKLNSNRLALAIAAALAASVVSSQAQSAVATISGVPVSGGFDYTILLTNPSSDLHSISNSFWYGWTLSGNNLPFSSQQRNANSLGWANILDGDLYRQWEKQFRFCADAGTNGNIHFF